MADDDNGSEPEQIRLMKQMVALSEQRTRLANERTSMATRRTDMSAERSYMNAERTLSVWIRTGLALMTFGIAMDRFGVFLDKHSVKAAHYATRNDLLGSGGAALVAFGTLMAVMTGIRFLMYSRIYCRTHDIPYRHGPFLASFFAFLAAAFGGVLLIMMLVFYQ